MTNLVALLSGTIMFSCAALKETVPPRALWVSAYYAGTMQGCGPAGHLRPEQIDYSAVTHIFHFSVIPNSDGSIDYTAKCISPENSSDLIGRAHAAGKKVLISVGGWQTEPKFLDATGNSARQKFISNLVSFIVSRGYDGIDIDWEPLSPSSTPQYVKFITELRSALDKIRPRPLLTAAVIEQPATFAKLQNNFDQINIMTYEMSGPSTGRSTWHNSPLYGVRRFSVIGEPVHSAEGMVTNFTAAGVQPAKLGIGIEFYGALWQGGDGTPTGGVSAPGQSWRTAPTIQMVPYFRIMDTYYKPQNYRWDNYALVPYLSIHNTDPSRDMFISYDDEHSCREKVRFVRDKGLGGVIIFELGGGWRPDEPVKDGLLQAVRNAVTDP